MARVDDDPFADIGKAAEDPFADIGAPSPLGREVIRQGIDVVKQIPSAIPGVAEAALTFIPQTTGLLGGLAEKIPGLEPSPQETANRQRLLELTAGARKPFTRYVPEPETRFGQIARTGIETALSTALSPFRGGLSIPRAAGVGGTAGVTSELAGQATEGTAAEPFARVGGALVAGTAAARAAESAAAKAALPTIKEAKTAGADLYDQFRASGFQLNSQAAPVFAQALGPAMARQGLTETTAGKTWNVIEKFSTKPFRTPQDFHDAYQELGQIARSAGANEGERLAANIAQERLLGFLENVPPQLVSGGNPAQGAALLREANQNWAAAKRAENVSGRITKAEQVASGQYSGLGLENELRRRIGIMGLPPEAAPRGAQRGFSEAERLKFERFGEGTTGQNIRRYLTGALSGRGGIGVGGLFLGGGGLNAYLGGDPITSGAIGVGLPLSGLGLAMLGNRSALARARDIERMLLARAPLAAGRIPRSEPLLPLATLPPTLATLGE